MSGCGGREPARRPWEQPARRGLCSCVRRTGARVVTAWAPTPCQGIDIAQRYDVTNGSERSCAAAIQSRMLSGGRAGAHR